MTQWSDDWTKEIATEIRHLRGDRSAQWLSDRTDELGHRVTRSIITDLETGRRKYISLAELTVLAAALDTYPIALAYPDIQEQTKPLPSLDEVEKFFAAQWFSAEHFFTIGRDSYMPSHRSPARAHGLRAARHRADAENQLRQLVEILGDAERYGITETEGLTQAIATQRWNMDFWANEIPMPTPRTSDERAKVAADEIREEMGLPPKHKGDSDGG